MTTYVGLTLLVATKSMLLAEMYRPWAVHMGPEAAPSRKEAGKRVPKVG